MSHKPHPFPHVCASLWLTLAHNYARVKHGIISSLSAPVHFTKWIVSGVSKLLFESGCRTSAPYLLESLLLFLPIHVEFCHASDATFSFQLVSAVPCRFYAPGMQAVRTRRSVYCYKPCTDLQLHVYCIASNFGLVLHSHCEIEDVKVSQTSNWTLIPASKIQQNLMTYFN